MQRTSGMPEPAIWAKRGEGPKRARSRLAQTPRVSRFAAEKQTFLLFHRDNSFSGGQGLPFLATSLLSGCATAAFEKGGMAASAPVVDCSRGFQARAAEERAFFSDGAVVIDIMAGYAVLRAQVCMDNFLACYRPLGPSWMWRSFDLVCSGLVPSVLLYCTWQAFADAHLSARWTCEKTRMQNGDCWL